MGSHTIHTSGYPEELARQGVTLGVMRYVLVISTLSSIIALALDRPAFAL